MEKSDSGCPQLSCRALARIGALQCGMPTRFMGRPLRTCAVGCQTGMDVPEHAGKPALSCGKLGFIDFFYHPSNSSSVLNDIGAEFLADGVD